MPRLLLTSLLALVAAAHGFAAGTLEAKGPGLVAKNANFQATFSQAALISMRNLATNEEYINEPGSNWIEMSLLEPTGDALRADSWRIVRDASGAEAAELTVVDSSRTITMRVGFDDSTEELFVRFSGKSKQPGLRSVFWGIQGVELTNSKLVVPAQAGTYVDRESTPDLVGVDYPVHWESQFVVYQAPKGSLLIYARDPKPHFKRLLASKQTGNLDFGFEMFADAPWSDAASIPEFEWRFRAYAGDYRQGVRRYRDWSRNEWPMVQATGDRSWIKDVRVVVTMIGPDVAALEKLATKLDPARTLVYLMDWRQDPYDINYPNYAPGAMTAPFVIRAKQLGFRLMLHMNAVGVSAENPDYQLVKDHQILDAEDQSRIGWLWDLPEGDVRRFAFINPAFKPYQQLFINRIRLAVEALKPDAIHLDAGGILLNDGNGLIDGKNTSEGMREFFAALHAAYPNIVFGTESTNEISAPFTWLAQRWNSDSPPHPVSTYLFGDQEFFYGFLDQPYPDEPEFTEFIKRYEGQYVSPTPTISRLSDLDDDRPVMNTLLNVGKIFQQQEFTAQWDADWQNDMFRYVSADGQTTAAIETDTNEVRLRIGKDVVYRRVRNAQHVNTPLFTPNWGAYTSTTLLGLDPTRQYWLTGEPYRPEGEPHLTTMPDDTHLGPDTMTAPEFASFDVRTVSAPALDFVARLATATRGVALAGAERTIRWGARIAGTRVVVNSELRNGVILMQPPFRPAFGGTTWADFKIRVPLTPRAFLRAEVALPDFVIGLSDGVTFSVRVDNKELWQQFVSRTGWTPMQIDMTPYVGKTVNVRLTVHPGPAKNPYFDWGCWSGLRLETDAQRPGSLLDLEVPGAAQTTVAGDATLDSSAGESAKVRMDIPGRFVVFPKPGYPVSVRQSLLQIPFRLWKQGYNGVPAQFRVENNGDIVKVASGGIEKEYTVVARPTRNSRTLITWVVQVPENASALRFSAGLADAPPPFPPGVDYSGVEFSVVLNTDVIWKWETRDRGWKDATIDLKPYRGKTVLLEFITDAQKNDTFDWAHWADLLIEE